MTNDHAWPRGPSWGFVAFTLAAMLSAIGTVWLVNWLAARSV